MKITLNQPYSFYQLGKRSSQQDFRFPNEDIPQEYKPFFILCDGVGGSKCGDIASETVCLSLAKAMENVNFNEEFSMEDFQNKLTFMYDCLYKQMKKTTFDMSTTLTFICFHKGGVLVAHIGDSRIYQIRPGVGIIYRSEDHSLVNSLVHSGNLSPEQAINHPKSNYITRSVCYSENMEDRPAAKVVQLQDIQKGDYFFLCSDGVLHCVDDNSLLEILSEKTSDKDKIDKIAKRSKDSTDNNTAILVGIKQVEDVQTMERDTEIKTLNNQTVPLDRKVKSKEVYPKENSSLLHKLKTLFK